MASGRERYERTAAERKRVRTAQREAQRRARRRRQALVAGSGAVALVIIAVIVLLVATSTSKNHGVAAGLHTTPTVSTTPTVVATSSPVSTAGPTGSPTGVHATNAAGNVCTYTPDPQTELKSGPGLPPDTKATGQHTLTIVYNVGTVVIKLNPKAPCTVNSFQWLASQNFFTGTICHRLVTSGIFVLQCGDPTGTGAGGPGYTIPDEDLADAKYPAGEVAMANTGQTHTGGSQFFLVYKDSSSTLGPTYTPFGTITSGLNVIQKVAAAGVVGGGTDGKPKEAVTIKSFTIT